MTSAHIETPEETNQAFPQDDHTPRVSLSPLKNQRVVLVLSLLVACGATEISGRLLREMAIISKVTADVFSLLALILLWSVMAYIFRFIRHFRLVRYLILLGCFMLFLGICSSFVEELPAVQDIQLLGKTQLQHVQAEHLIQIVGAFFLVSGFFVALLEGEFARRVLSRDQDRLRQSIAEGEQRAQALQQSKENLEQTIADRTKELAEKNARLEHELIERRRAEARLAMRLRYEEYLANCSQILLSGAEAAQALQEALQELLQASRVCRVYIAENRHDHEQGLVAECVYEVWNREKCPDTPSGLHAVLPYEGDLARWREALSRGEAVWGAAGAFPQAEQACLEAQGVASMLLLPIAWEDRWRGFLAFEDRANPREWMPEECRMLRTAAEMVGACRARQHGEAILRSAYGDLENRVAERTADLQATNKRLQQEIMDRLRAEEEKAVLESQLIQAQKMQAIGTLAGGIAHDFNNILSAILGHAELGLRKMGVADENRRHVEEILHSGNRAKELVRQILVFSRQAEQDWSPVVMAPVVSEVLEMMGPSLPAGVRLETAIDTGAGTVLSDPIQMHQVVLNLCSNGAQAMKESGGVLRVELTTERLDKPLITPHAELSRGVYVVLRVADSGPGMTPQVIERIFEPFFTTKKVGEGTGMGLSILHGIVAAHHGAVLVESSPGKGADFRVYLPRYQQEAKEQHALPGAVESLMGAERILVVDDEAQLVALWKESLEQYGYQVTTFSDSSKALAHFQDQSDYYDLVLLDQTMPIMTGAELARALLALRPEIPIVMASGFSEALSPKKAAEIGIRSFVYKPILAKDLCSAIRDALDKQLPRAGTEDLDFLSEG